MDSFEWYMFGVGILILIFMMSRALPYSVILFNPTAIRSSFLPGRSLKKSNKHIESLMSQIIEMGYEPAGLLREQKPLWGKVDGIAYFKKGAQEYIIVIPLYGRFAMYVETVFDTGHIILTGNRSFQTIDNDQLTQCSLTGADLSTILEYHREQVAACAADNAVPRTDYSGQVILGFTHPYYSIPAIQKRMRLAGLLSLVLPLVLIALLVVTTLDAIAD